MDCKIIKIKGTWRDVADSARTTIGKEAGTKEPSDIWKKRMLLCEHSPIRQLLVKAKWTDLKYWVSVHIVRHWLGIVHWVQSQRPDRLQKNAPNRDKEPQDTPVQHEIEVNAQALINISRKRLCKMAMPETREAWEELISEISKKEPQIAKACVPDCIYRGHCYEYKTCGFYKTVKYDIWLDQYREGIRD